MYIYIYDIDNTINVIIIIIIFIIYIKKIETLLKRTFIQEMLSTFGIK